MWNRADLKSRAKACLKQYYWMAFLVTLIVSILGGEGSAGSGVSVSNGFRQNNSNTSRIQSDGEAVAVFISILAIIGIVIIVALIIGFLFKIFVGNSVIVGGKRFFMESRAVQRSAGVGTVFYVFGCGNYLNVVKTMFLRDLFTGLWSMLLVIPGIVKSYEYYMIPYILSENPDIHYKEAFRLSKEMMDGNKWDTFVLELSFIGWYLLGALACGVGVLFVQPYIEATFAELYGELRNKVGYVGLKGFGGEGPEVYDNIVSEQ